MTHYEAMFIRRSVRQYAPEPLPQEALDEILAYAAAVEPLPGQQAQYRLLTPEEMGLKLAPHYLAASCESGNEAYANLGYVLEKLDLELQSRGLGSLWYGMKLPRDSRPDDAIVMAFGRTAVPPRTAGTEFSRLPLAELSDGDDAVLRAMRLAPSAVNSQPWVFRRGDKELEIAYKGRGLLKGRLEKKLNKIDLGIVTRFAVTALEQEGKQILSLRPETEGREFRILIRYE